MHALSRYFPLRGLRLQQTLHRLNALPVTDKYRAQIAIKLVPLSDFVERFDHAFEVLSRTQQYPSSLTPIKIQVSLARRLILRDRFLDVVDEPFGAAWSADPIDVSNMWFDKVGQCWLYFALAFNGKATELACVSVNV